MNDTKTNGVISRRALLGGTAALGVAGASKMALAASNPDNLPPNVSEWTPYLGAGVDANPYGMPSEYENHVVRRNVEWLTASTESSVNFTPLQDLEGFVTPNGLCFERHHGGVPEVIPSDYRLMINGLVDRELIFTLEDLKRFPQTNKFYFLECAANGGMEWRGAQLNGCQFTFGMVHNVQYTGVRLSDLVRETGLKPNAKWMLAEGGDSAGMNRSVPIEKVLDDCMIAWAMNGEALRPEQGYPARLVVPGWEGNMWVKWIRRLEFGDMPYMAREETSKYTDLMSDGKARMFTWVMDAKSVVTSPSPEKPILQKGVHQLRGLAWSGRGKITRVDVSIDGGKNWKTAELHGPIMEKCLTRFTMPFEWNGEELLVQSRAIDETGYVQPTIQELQNVRGLSSVYHNNSIATWLVNKSGKVDNVRLG
ncbi:sulfite dehydrogenase [Alphaproteobacteria bacterium]|jgi:sulfane dehydrogenase subunit SoxC|nr:sulfite dehydrogenase [Alphaproteobacteria bacterium]MDC1115720.1 sulfite dehydrogenase [Alphaproteobacteria bacterium]